MFVVIENTVSSFSIFYDKISVEVIELSGTKLDKWKGYCWHKKCLQLLKSLALCTMVSAK